MVGGSYSRVACSTSSSLATPSVVPPVWYVLLLVVRLLDGWVLGVPLLVSSFLCAMFSGHVPCDGAQGFCATCPLKLTRARLPNDGSYASLGIRKGVLWLPSHGCLGFCTPLRTARVLDPPRSDTLLEARGTELTGGVVNALEAQGAYPIPEQGLPWLVPSDIVSA